MGLSGYMHVDRALLKNSYYGFRHGESEANVEGVIVSDPAVGTVKYGLTREGRRQVAASAALLQELDGEAVIVTSDFRRTVETAEIIRSILGLDAVRLEPRLRERFFGHWDGACYLHYSDTWKKDVIDPDQMVDGVESANSVRRRMVETVMSLEAEYSGLGIVLVSHGDPLRLLQTAFEGLETELNRTLPYFETGSWRLLNPASP